MIPSVLKRVIHTNKWIFNISSSTIFFRTVVVKIKHTFPLLNAVRSSFYAHNERTLSHIRGVEVLFRPTTTQLKIVFYYNHRLK